MLTRSTRLSICAEEEKAKSVSTNLRRTTQLLSLLIMLALILKKLFVICTKVLLILKLMKLIALCALITKET